MGPPVLEWYASTSSTEPTARHHFGSYEAGSDNDVDGFFYVYNNKGGTGAATAANAAYTTYDDRELREVSSLVVGRWLDVLMDDYNGTGEHGVPKRVGGSDPANQYDLSPWPLGNGEYWIVSFVHVVPETGERGLHQYVHAIHYEYT